MSVGAERCPYCNKRVYHAERVAYEGQFFHSICMRNAEKERMAAEPLTFSISERMFCNPEEGVRTVQPDNQQMVQCHKCGHVNISGGFCLKCRAPL